MFLLYTSMYAYIYQVVKSFQIIKSKMCMRFFWFALPDSTYNYEVTNHMRTWCNLRLPI
jgi:hypothetical protein